MTITATVRNYRRVEHAEITCAPTALLTGVNASGKSSIAEAIQACLTGTTLAKRLGLAKKDAGQILHDGTERATARLVGPEGEATVTWPDCEFITQGKPPHASAFAAGVLFLDQLDPKERAAALEPYLRATPTEEDLRLEMQEKFSAPSIAEVWTEIQQSGWDATAARHETERRDASRDWGKLAGTTWGSDKAARWQPDGWVEELGTMTPDDLKKLIDEARQAVEQAVGKQAVDEARLAHLRDLSSQVEATRTAVVEAEQTATAAATKLKAVEDERKALPAPDPGGDGLACPHCQNLVRVQGSVLVKAQQVDPAETKARRMAIATADGALSNAQHLKQQADRALSVAQVALRDREAAATELALAPTDIGSGAEYLDAARATLAQRERDLVMFNQAAEAKKLHRQWQRSDLLVKLLGPGGLRAKKLGQAVEAFNTGILAPLCEAAQWPPVNLTPGLVPRMGERPWTMLSGGHLYRMRAVLQVAMATLDESSLVVLDGADVLDVAGRNGLFRLLVSSKIPAVVTMTMKKNEVPNLSVSGIGQTWWIESGRTTTMVENV